MLSSTSWTGNAFQREEKNNKLVLCHRIINGCYIIHSFLFTPHPSPHIWHNHLYYPVCKSAANLSSFAVSAIPPWNCLPPIVVCAPSFSSFKRILTFIFVTCKSLCHASPCNFLWLCLHPKNIHFVPVVKLMKLPVHMDCTLLKAAHRGTCAGKKKFTLIFQLPGWALVAPLWLAGEPGAVQNIAACTCTVHAAECQLDRLIIQDLVEWNQVSMVSDQKSGLALLGPRLATPLFCVGIDTL